MNANILSILGVAAKEDVLSNLLRYCLEESAPFRAAFLQDICNVHSTRIQHVSALTRVSTGTSGIPDLVIAADGGDGKHLVILENKLKADEGSDQTTHYSSLECVRDVKARVGWAGSNSSERFIFLTLFPDQEPQAPVFHKVTYRDILRVIHTLPTLQPPLAEQLLLSLAELLQDFYSKERVAPDDVLLPNLQESDPLEGNFLYFKGFVEGLHLTHDLQVENTFRSSARGRRFFGAQISKASWHPGMMPDAPPYHLDSKRDFSIHFEPQFHYLKGLLELYLHYEVNPYQTLSWVQSNISSSDYQSFQAVRNLFIDFLRGRQICDLEIGGGSNQIAKARLKLTGLSVAAARQQVSEFINRVAVDIDAIRNDPNGVFAG